jgi:hypothetical protein
MNVNFLSHLYKIPSYSEFKHVSGETKRQNKCCYSSRALAYARRMFENVFSEDMSKSNCDLRLTGSS